MVDEMYGLAGDGSGTVFTSTHRSPSRRAMRRRDLSAETLYAIPRLTSDGNCARPAPPQPCPAVRLNTMSSRRPPGVAGTEAGLTARIVTWLTDGKDEFGTTSSVTLPPGRIRDKTPTWPTSKQ